MNAAGIPEPKDIRDLLEGYGLDLQTSLSLSGTWELGSAIITNIDTTRLGRYMNVFGAGIPAAAQIVSVDIVSATAGQITISAPTTAAGNAAAITISYFCVVSDEWLQSTLSNEIIPWVQRIARQKFDAIETVTEYYDGTGESLLILRRRPIVQLISLNYTNVDPSFYYLAPTAIQVISDEGILKAQSNCDNPGMIPIFARGSRNLCVTYQVGKATCPSDVARGITLLAADLTLAHIASKTGGGSPGLPGFNPDYGPNGKWSTHRADLARRGISALRPYMTGAFS